LQCFETADAQLMIGAFTAKQHAMLWIVLGQPGLAAEVEALTTRELARRLQSDRANIASILLSKPAQQWEDEMNQAGVPAARVRRLDEALAHPQVASRKVLQGAVGLDGEHQGLRAPVAAFSYEHDGPGISSHGASPGQHSAEILTELGYTDKAITAMESLGVIGTS